MVDTHGKSKESCGTCPWCDSNKLESDSDKNTCQNCGKAFGDIVGNHYELLKELEGDNDPAISDLGSAILDYGTNNTEGVEW